MIILLKNLVFNMKNNIVIFLFDKIFMISIYFSKNWNFDFTFNF